MAALSGDEFANSLLLEAGNRIGNVVAGVVSTLNPEKVLVGGRFARMGPLILSNINDEQNNVCTGINPFQILFQFASSLSPMNAEIPAP